MTMKSAIALIGGMLFLALFGAAQVRDPIRENKRGAVHDDQYMTPEEKQLIESLDGPALFQAYCATCHGREATGKGPAASALKTAPPDLTRISERNGGKFPFRRIEKIISGEGLDLESHGNREMPIWGPIFGQIAWDQDFGSVRIYRITKYLESLQAKQLPGRLPSIPLTPAPEPIPIR
jgi:mono/diheme cytochrome c family protein